MVMNLIRRSTMFLIVLMVVLSIYAPAFCQKFHENSLSNEKGVVSELPDVDSKAGSSLDNSSNKKNIPYKRLYIGDKVPMDSVLFNGIKNYIKPNAKLSDFKGRFIILDFWDRYCTSCIAAFPKMVKLQEQFKDDIQILLVTSDTQDKLTNLFARSAIVRETNLPMIIGDTILSERMFPHRAVPYHVWLDRDGKVIATTWGQETNSENLKTLIAGKPLDLFMRNDIDESNDVSQEIKNQRLSLLKIGRGLYLPHLEYYSPIPTRKQVNSSATQRMATNVRGEGAFVQVKSYPYYSLFMDFLPGGVIWRDIIFTDSIGNGKGFRIFNSQLDNLYKIAYLNTGTNVAKIIAEGKAKLLYEGITDTANALRQFVRNSFCYESNLPEYNLESAKKLLQQDLTRFFGMKGLVEDKEIRCLVLIRLGTDKEKNLWAKDQNLPNEYNVRKTTKSGHLLKNLAGIALFTEFKMANRGMMDPVIIDETNFTNEEKYEKKIDLLIKCSLQGSSENINNIQNELERYGLGVKEEMRKMKVLTLMSPF